VADAKVEPSSELGGGGSSALMQKICEDAETEKDEDESQRCCSFEKMSGSSVPAHDPRISI
jgi:hypothetical protein